MLNDAIELCFKVCFSFFFFSIYSLRVVVVTFMRVCGAVRPTRRVATACALVYMVFFISIELKLNFNRSNADDDLFYFNENNNAYKLANNNNNYYNDAHDFNECVAARAAISYRNFNFRKRFFTRGTPIFFRKCNV